MPDRGPLYKDSLDCAAWKLVGAAGGNCKRWGGGGVVKVPAKSANVRTACSLYALFALPLIEHSSHPGSALPHRFPRWRLPLPAQQASASAARSWVRLVWCWPVMQRMP